MRILYSFTCEHADPRPDGRIDVHGVFQELFARSFPAAQDQLVFVLGVEWDAEEPGRREFKIDLLDPSGSPSLTIQGHTDVTPPQPYSPPPRTVLILPMEDIRFPVAGTYIFHLSVDGQNLPVAPLHLIEHPDVE